MQPGGIVPWHSHNERPAMIYVVSGEVVEYASSCAVPITHRAAQSTPLPTIDLIALALECLEDYQRANPRGAALRATAGQAPPMTP